MKQLKLRRGQVDIRARRVHFVKEPIRAFAERLRKQAGKNVWLMGGGEIIGSFLDEDTIDEFVLSVVPTFIGEGISPHCAGAS